MADRNIYIDNIDVEKALDILFNNMEIVPQEETIPTVQSVGRITSEPVFARVSSPSYSASAMDGILIFAHAVKDASETHPVFLKEEEFTPVNTGNPIDHTRGNCVIMIEDVIPQPDGTYKILKSARPWQHIRPVGEDMIAGEMILKSHHKVLPQDLGALLSAGITQIDVYKKPKVGIMPTGNEVIDILKEEYREGTVIDSNSYVFASLIEEWGATPFILEKSDDDFENLKKSALKGCEEYDILVINAGSSAGTKDFTKKVIEELGEVLVHGIAIKPGKPTILGKIGGKPVLGIPGYPVSAYLSLEIFLKPLLENLTKDPAENIYMDAILTKTLTSSLKHKELVRVSLYYMDNRLMATPLARGAGITSSLVKADGILEIPKYVEGIAAYEHVKVRLIKPLKEIKDYLISVGSHDIVMDLIGDRIKLTSTHVGSFGGIMAIKKRSTHIAPIHILDEGSGTYNIETVKKYFPDREMALIKGVGRTQGIIVAKGNPLGIKHIGDLAREDVTFINRQRGAGTRILLDFLMREEGIDPETIDGYDREGATHLEVAMAVKCGTADTAMGIMEASVIAGCDFIPIKEEEYDFLVEKTMLEDPKIKEFISFLKSDFFQQKLLSLSGYTGEESGSIINI